MKEINYVVEGALDEVVASKLMILAGIKPGRPFVKGGKEEIKKKISGYNNAAKRHPYLIFVDLDKDECSPSLIRSWIETTSEFLCFRVVERSIESWLIADIENFSDYFHIPIHEITTRPDEIPFPKRRLIELVDQYSPNGLKKLIVPRNESGRKVGPGYNIAMITYVTDVWNPSNARKYSPSLERSINRLDELVLKI